jgi:hypothetical protein
MIDPYKIFPKIPPKMDSKNFPKINPIKTLLKSCLIPSAQSTIGGSRRVGLGVVAQA